MLHDRRSQFLPQSSNQSLWQNILLLIEKFFEKHLKHVQKNLAQQRKNIDKLRDLSSSFQRLNFRMFDLILERREQSEMLARV